jgi:hypothetical protein
MLAATTGGADVLTARDQQIVIERDLGDTIVEISQRHGISHQRVSVITRRAKGGRHQGLHRSARGLEHRRAVRLRHTYRPDYSVALDFSTWLTKELRDSGLNLQLESRRAYTRRGWRGVVMTPRQRRPRSNAPAAASSSSSTEEVVAA